MLPSFAQTHVRNFTATQPTFVALDTSGGVTWLYVSEHGGVAVPPTGGGRILRFNVATGEQQIVANRGTANGEFMSPDAILVYGPNDIFIADRYKNRVERLSINPTTGVGTYVMGWGSGTAGAPDELRGPVGLARDAAGAIYVAEHGDMGAPAASDGGDFVSKYTISGSGSAAIATRVWRLGNGFNTPYGIAVSGSQLFISDGFSQRIQVWDLNGVASSPISLPGVIPLGLSIDSSSGTPRLWVAESSDNGGGAIQRVERLTLAGASTSMSFGTQGSANGQFSLPFHALANAAGTQLYVADYGNNRVQVFDISGTPPPPTAPVINSPTAATATVGTAFSYQITSSAGTPTSYNAAPLPAGLSVNTTTGAITGTPTTAGSINVTLTATNSAGSDTETLAVTVNPSAPAGDTTSPTITAFALGTGNTNTVANFNVVFSEPVTGVDASDFAVNATGTTSGNVTGVTGSGANYTVTISYAGEVGGPSGSVQVAIRTTGTGIIDAASNPFRGEGLTGTQPVTVNNATLPDATAPVATVTAGTLSGTTLPFTVTFDETVTGVTAGDFVATTTGSATATVASVTGSGTTWTANVTVGGTGTVQLLVVGGVSADIRNAATHWLRESASSSAVSVGGGGGDTTAPTVASFTIASSTASSVTYQIVFSEAVTGVGTADFTATRAGSTGGTATVGAVTGSGTTYTVPVSFTGSGGTVALALNASGTGIQDTAGNPIAGGSTGPTHTVSATDTTAPTVSSFTIASSTASSVTYQIVFSEAVTGVGDVDFTATRGGSTGGTATVGAVTGSGTTYTIPVSFTGSGGNVVLSLNASGHGIADTAGNALVGGATGPTHTVGAVDTTAPTVASFTIASSTASNVTYQIVFSETVTGVTSSDFTASRTGSTGGTATLGAFTAVSGTTYTQVVNFTGSGGSVGLALNASGTGIQDAAGNAIVGGATGPAHTVAASDTTAPTVASFTIASAAGSGVTYQIVFSESVTGVTASDFTVVRAPSSSGTATIGTLSGSGTTYLIPVSYTGSSGSVQLSLNAGGTGIQDAAGNAIAGGATAPSYTVDATIPSVASFTIASSTNSSVTYQIVFSEPVTGVDSADFAASRTGSSGGVASLGALTEVNSTTYTQVVNFSGSGGSVGLTLNAVGSSIRDMSNNLMMTSATGPTHTVAVSTIIPVVTNYTVTGSVGATITYQVQATNNPTSYASTAMPSGFTLNSTTGLISGAAPAPTSATVTVMATNASGTGSGTITFNIGAGGGGGGGGGIIIIPPPIGGGGSTPPAVKANQTIVFTSPVSAILVNQPINLGATASSGLPITYSVVAGNATIAGNTLTIRDTRTVVVRASQHGNENFNAATPVEVSFNAQKNSQSINFAAVSDMSANGGTVTLNATASSGLPVTFSVTGPATLVGNSLRLNGSAGVVTVTAAQSGNDAYNPAATVVRTFNVRGAGAQVFFGSMGTDAFAVGISSDGSKGIFLARLASTGQGIAASFKVNANGAFNAITTATIPAAEVSNGFFVNPTAAAGQTYTINGTVNNGVISGTIVELGQSFTANVQPSVGTTAALAGVYTASVPGSASGETYIVVGPNGQAYALAMLPSGAVSGTGTVSADGTVNISANNGSMIAANIEGSNVTGQVTAAGATSNLVGISHSADRTDRLINLSSRLRVVAGDASRSVIAGFVVGGTESKRVLVRAVGPGLSGFGVSGALANPGLQIYRGTTLVAENNDWSNNTDVSAIGDSVGAFKLTASSADAALVANLEPGAYTAVVQANGGNGVVLVEVYDAATGTALASQQMVNISTRGYVDTGDGQLIAGFVVTGNAPKRVLIRGIGPSLTQFGVPNAVSDPQLKLYQGNTLVAQNDDWGTAQTVSASQIAASAADVGAASTATGAFPLAAGSKDAAIVITLMPGQYSAVVSGANNGTGAGLVEVYEIPNL